jgi:hypothetical protein
MGMSGVDEIAFDDEIRCPADDEKTPKVPSSGSYGRPWSIADGDDHGARETIMQGLPARLFEK